MKKQILLITALFFTAWATTQAQTQQGYVKTKGRLANDGSVIPGQGLKGATVSIKGRTAVLVNADDGSFSFPVPGAQFRVDSVRKKGYQLVDMDALSKTYKHSANPIYFVMETPEQQLQDQLVAERKIRRTLINQLHQREDEIEALKEQQKISDDEYRQALQKLYEETDQNDQLVKDMVERYSKIDYDQLSEFDKQISEYILNGELTQADSLLRTKGDLNERVEQYRKHEAINAKEKVELSQRQEQLEQSELLAQNELEDLANDCYRKFEILKMRHENDSAAYYIELRASLDTTNMIWLNETGDFIKDYMSQFEKALFYYNKGLNYSLYCNNNNHIEMFYSDIGNVYNTTGDYDKALEMYNKGLKIFLSSIEIDSSELVTGYNNIGLVYLNKGDFSKSLYYFDSALLIANQDQVKLSDCYNKLGGYYSSIGEHVKSLEFDKKALHIIKELSYKDDPVLASSYDNLGCCFFYNGLYDSAMKYLDSALIIRERIYSNNHPDLALSYNNIGMLYSYLGNYTMSTYYLNKASIVYQNIFGNNSLNTALVLNNIGMNCKHNEQYREALLYIEKALSIRLLVLGDKHPITASSYNNLGAIYDDMGELNKALEYYEHSLNINMSVFEEPNPHIANNYNNIGGIYLKQNNLEQALKYMILATEMDEKNYGTDHPDVAIDYANISAILWKKGDTTMALNYLNKAINIISEKFGSDHPYIKIWSEKAIEMTKE